jgi:hypothetical protein
VPGIIMFAQHEEYVFCFTLLMLISMLRFARLGTGCGAITTDSYRSTFPRNSGTSVLPPFYVL